MVDEAGPVVGHQGIRREGAGELGDGRGPLTEAPAGRDRVRAAGGRRSVERRVQANDPASAGSARQDGEVRGPGPGGARPTLDEDLLILPCIVERRAVVASLHEGGDGKERDERDEHHHDHQLDEREGSARKPRSGTTECSSLDHDALPRSGKARCVPRAPPVGDGNCAGFWAGGAPPTSNPLRGYEKRFESAGSASGAPALPGMRGSHRQPLFRYEHAPCRPARSSLPSSSSLLLARRARTTSPGQTRLARLPRRPPSQRQAPAAAAVVSSAMRSRLPSSPRRPAATASIPRARSRRTARRASSRWTRSARPRSTASVRSTSASA